MTDPDASAVASARQAGHDAALSSVESAPADPLLRVAWAQGFGQVDQLRDAVSAAREAGATWKQIAAVTGEHWRTAQTKYGSGYAAQRRYREKLQAERQGDQ